MRKMAAFAAAICMAFAASATVVACNGGDNSSSSSSSSSVQKVNYSITFKDQDGLSVVPVSLQLLQNEEVESTATISAQGVASGEVDEGSYVVEVELPEGYLQTSNTITVNFTAADATEEILVFNNTPNGTAVRPFGFIVSDAYEMETTIPADGTYYYSCSAVNATLVIESESVQVHYNDTVYSPREGVVEVPFEAEEGDAKGQIMFTVTNLTNADVTVVLKLVYPEGSYENPETLVIGEATTATVVGDGIVYYEWTATGAGTLTISSVSEINSVSLYNKTSGVATGYVHLTATESVSVVVSAGDVVSVMVAAGAPVEDTDVNVVEFTATLE